jgi:protein dithiol oxidoreductase (disulfide-forming)
MNIQRRELCMGLAGAGLGLLPLLRPEVASAQDAPVEGTHFVRLSQPVATSAPGKVEVVEFFWYGCPHCNAFEPSLDAWSRKLPADVVFRRMPVALREDWAMHQRIYFALEAMGQVEAMHRKTFYAIHKDRMPLEKPAEIAAFMTKNGVDGTKFLENLDSFSVQTKARQANQLAAAYKIDGVPTLGVQGRFTTAPSLPALGGSHERTLAVVEFLVQRSRKAG